MSMPTILRRTLIVGLAVAIPVGVWDLGGVFGVSDPYLDDARGRLEERVAEYIELRMQDDWLALYGMLDPEQRKVLPQGQFLQVFGTGVLAVNQLEALEYKVDDVLRRAAVAFHTEAELVISKLPPEFRRGFQMPENPDDLKQSIDHEIMWVWRDGEWFYQAEREVVSGVDSQGRELKAVPPQGAGPR